VSLYRGLRPLVFGLDPELAHRLALRAIASRLAGPPAPPPDPRLARTLMGLGFPNPLGIAAGFDKDGEAIRGLFGLGFGFVEVGTTTPRPQAGNPRPRLFRLTGDHAAINRLGFNNRGHEALAAQLAGRPPGRIVGVNLGANRDSADRIADYEAGVTRFAGLADYLAVNVSSPNTPGLRTLQEREALTELLARLTAARAAATGAGTRRVPLLLKIAPDLDDAATAAIAETALAAGIDGIIVSNTTLARDGLADRRHAAEAGGLSGRPIFRRSTVLLAKLRRLVGQRLVLIGVGGVDSVDAAWIKILAGADLVQLYTGLVFEGPGLPRRILTGLAERLDRHGYTSIGEAVGAEVDRWAESAPV